MEISIREVVNQLKNHQHEYKFFHLPGVMWVDFRELRDIMNSETHHLDDWGQYFAPEGVTGYEDNTELTTKPKY